MRLIVRVAIGAGVLTVAGAATRIAGAAAVLDTSWYDGMSSASGSAAMMRLLAGVLIGPCRRKRVLLMPVAVVTAFLTTASTN